ncbi:MAG TPA: hypothetical protein P5140_08565 [Methanofastidiosum sp.]|nr:hypothetical protein [Methanofastidiosum sp.]
MGWTYTYKDKSESMFDFFSREFNYDNERSIGTVVDCAVKNFKTAYIAYKLYDKNTGEFKVIALICYLSFVRNSNNNIGYKNMDETMGVCSYECPMRILKLLTPTTDKNALEWREKCWDNIKAVKQRPKIKVGDIVVFEEGVTFTIGVVGNVFEVIDVKKHLFKCGGYGFVKIPPKILRTHKYNVSYK